MDGDLKNKESLVPEDYNEYLDARIEYSKKEYVIYKCECGYVVRNLNKNFSEGHTHMESFNMAKKIIDYCIKKKIPHQLSPYLLTSLHRISNDENYKLKLNELVCTKNQNEKKSKYANRSIPIGCVAGFRI